MGAESVPQKKVHGSPGLNLVDKFPYLIEKWSFYFSIFGYSQSAKMALARLPKWL